MLDLKFLLFPLPNLTLLKHEFVPETIIYQISNYKFCSRKFTIINNVRDVWPCNFSYRIL